MRSALRIRAPRPGRRRRRSRRRPRSARLPRHIPLRRSSGGTEAPARTTAYNTGKAVLRLLQDTCKNSGVTVIVITHNQAITAMADRGITVKSGTITDMRKNDHIIPAEQLEW